jgi:hypothetical protein
VAAVVGSAVGYFFSIIAVFTTIMAFMTLLIGAFNPLTFEKVRHYPHPRPVVERTVTATNPEHPHVLVAALGTNEETPAKDLSAQDKTTMDSRAASIAKTDTETRKPERKIKPERLAHLHQPKVLARQRQNYGGYGYGMALGYAEGYHPGLDGQR